MVTPIKSWNGKFSDPLIIERFNDQILQGQKAVHIFVVSCTVIGLRANYDERPWF